MVSSWTTAQLFLDSFDTEEKNRLYNDLLKVEKIHHKNQDVKHYSLRKIRRATHRLFDDRKQTCSFTNLNKDELNIQQVQEQHLFKSCYKVHVSFNSKEMPFSFVEELLVLLRKDCPQLQAVMA